MDCAASTISGSRTRGRNSTPSASATTKSSAVTRQDPTCAQPKRSGGLGSRRCGPFGTVPKLKIGRPMARSSVLSRCSPQMTRPPRPACRASKATRSPMQASSRRPSLSTTRMSPAFASLIASRKTSTLPRCRTGRAGPVARMPGCAGRSRCGAQRTAVPRRKQASARCGVVSSSCCISTPVPGSGASWLARLNGAGLSPLARCEKKCVLQAIIAPKHLGADEESRRAEDALGPGLLGLSPQARFGRLLLGPGENVCSRKRQLLQYRRQPGGLVHVGVEDEGELHDPAAERVDPRLFGPHHRDSHREQARPWKYTGLPPSQPVFATLARHVPPDIGAFLLLQHEGRGRHAQGPEDGPEQKRLPDDRDLVSPRFLFNPHDAEVTVVAGEVEPELAFRGRCRPSCRTCRIAPVWTAGIQLYVTRQRTSMLSLSGASAAISGRSNAQCGVKRATPLICESSCLKTSASCRSISEKYAQRCGTPCCTR